VFHAAHPTTGHARGQVLERALDTCPRATETLRHGDTLAVRTGDIAPAVSPAVDTRTPSCLQDSEIVSPIRKRSSVLPCLRGPRSAAVVPVVRWAHATS